jgi:hypothetical protein
MTDGNGYWIKMNSPDVLFVGGTVIPAGGMPSTYKLTPGWNLIGFKPQPTVQNETVHDFLQSLSISSYDSHNIWVYTSSGSWIRDPGDGSTVLQPDQAVWIFVTATTAVMLKP